MEPATPTLEATFLRLITGDLHLDQIRDAVDRMKVAADAAYAARQTFGAQAHVLRKLGYLVRRRRDSLTGPGRKFMTELGHVFSLRAKRGGERLQTAAKFVRLGFLTWADVADPDLRAVLITQLGYVKAAMECIVVR